jgi:hypothetical protein
MPVKPLCALGSCNHYPPLACDNCYPSSHTPLSPEFSRKEKLEISLRNPALRPRPYLEDSLWSLQYFSHSPKSRLRSIRQAV